MTPKRPPQAGLSELEWKPSLARLGKMQLEWIRPARGPVAKPRESLREAMRSAGLVAFLERCLEASSPTTLVVNDPDRITDTRTALETLLELAREAGLSPQVRILFATGSHGFPPAERRAHEARCLPPALAGVPRCWHDARDSSAVVAVGDVRMHRWVAESEHLLAIGSMEPHYFAGVTGAHKTVSVGVLSYESLRDHHAHALSPDAQALRLEGNPVFEATAGIVRELQRRGKVIFAVDEVVVDGGIVACRAGDPLDALRDGLPQVRRIFSRCLTRPVDLAVARVHPPLSKSLYQADKGIKNVENAVRDGGVILLEASCEQGVGIGRFLQLMGRAPDPQTALGLIDAEGYQLGDHKALRLRRLTVERGVHVGLVSSRLPAPPARIAGMEPLESIDEAVAWGARRLGDQADRGVVVEDAGNMTLVSEALSAS